METGNVGGENSFKRLTAADKDLLNEKKNSQHICLEYLYNAVLLMQNTLQLFFIIHLRAFPFHYNKIDTTCKIKDATN